MEAFSVDQLVGIVEIVWVNVVLSGDNAVVIAMACRDLPPALRTRGMAIGAGVAVGLRIVFTLLISALLATPFLKLAGGILLLWIGAQLVGGHEGEEKEIQASSRLWGAVRTVAVADAVMSLDNVLAIAAAAKGSTFLLVLGLLISVPLIVAGAALIMRALERFPWLAWGGAVLLGWVAGEMMISDPALVGRFGEAATIRWDKPAAAAGAAIVVLLGLVLRAVARRRHPSP